MAKNEDELRNLSSRPTGASKKSAHPASQTPKRQNETPDRSNRLLFVILGVAGGGGLLMCCGVGAVIALFWGMKPPANRPQVAVHEVKIEAIDSDDLKKTAPPVEAEIKKPAVVAEKEPAPKLEEAKSAEASGAERTIPLPGPPQNVVVGGGGRFLVIYIPSVRQLVTFDVEKQELTRTLDVKDRTIHYAANARHLVIFPIAKKIHTFDLNSNLDPVVTPIPKEMQGKAINPVCMGSASNGPLFAYIQAEKRTVAMDLASQTITDVQWKHFGPSGVSGPLVLRASASGNLLVGREGGWYGLEFASFADGKQTGAVDTIRFQSATYALPSVDGKSIYTSRDVFSPDGKFVNAPANSTYFVPAHEPDFVLALKSSKVVPFFKAKSTQPPITSVSVYEKNKLTRHFKNCPEVNVESQLDLDKRCHYYPSRQMLIIITDTSIVIRRES